MKTTHIISILVSIVCLTQMANAETDTSWSFGVRQHAAQPDFPDISFGDGDISYGLAITAGDASGYWQGALLYTPDIEGVDDLDYALTPQINLILTENLWRMGVGGAATYISSESDRLKAARQREETPKPKPSFKQKMGSIDALRELYPGSK